MSARHPDQPLIEGRFKANPIVRYLLDNGAVGVDMNHLAMLDFSDEDRQQFAQLIGYSLGGYGDLGYVSDEAYERAAAQAYTDEQWDGKGYPPAGIECDYESATGWITVTVFAVKPAPDSTLWIMWEVPGKDWGSTHDPELFRPIRTPEQIAAEEREEEVAQIEQALHCVNGEVNRVKAVHLHTIGYRKQVAP